MLINTIFSFPGSLVSLENSSLTSCFISFALPQIPLCLNLLSFTTCSTPFAFLFLLHLSFHSKYSYLPTSESPSLVQSLSEKKILSGSPWLSSSRSSVLSVHSGIRGKGNVGRWSLLASVGRWSGGFPAPELLASFHSQQDILPLRRKLLGHFIYC